MVEGLEKQVKQLKSPKKESLKNPTELLLEPFRAKKKAFIEVIRNYLDLIGLLGDRLIDELGDLPPSIAYVVECLQGDEPLKVLDAVYKVKDSEIAKLSKEQAHLFSRLPNQMRSRKESAYDSIRFLVETDWGNATDLEYKQLFFLIDPLSNDSLKKLKYRHRSKIKLLKSLPAKSEVIDYATNQQYGSFLLALQKGNEEQFQKAYRLIRPVRLAFQLSH